jgi:hypothetical protein
MKCAFLCINELPTSGLIGKWRKPKSSYSKLTLEDTFSFILTTSTIPEAIKLYRRTSLYKTIATRLKDEGVVYLLTNGTDALLGDIFFKDFGFVFPTGRELLRILPFEILSAFARQKQLSMSENHFGIYVNRLDKYRESFLSDATQAVKNLTIFTERKAALSLYFDNMYARTGLSVPVRDLVETLDAPDVLILLDDPSCHVNFQNCLYLTDPEKLPISFSNDSLSPLLDGLFPSLGAKETEFLLHSMPNRLFPTTGASVFKAGFSVEQVYPK